MEQHHRSQVRHGKKWKDYLFEFFMLFLAVFCGFLAEWELEQTIEHQRKKQFIQSLAEDLKRDTSQVIRDMRFNRISWNTAIQYSFVLQVPLFSKIRIAFMITVRKLPGISVIIPLTERFNS